jgi:hypothetical protein
MDTRLLELESGMTQNESVTFAVRSVIEAAVLELIKQGDERGYWKIVYPEDWDSQVAAQEQAYWMSLKESGSLTDAEDVKQYSKDPKDLPLWKRILLKNDTNKPILEKKNEDI